MTHGTDELLLVLSESARAWMVSAAARAHPNDTGVVLVGVYLDGEPWVTSAVEIATSDRGRHHYRIPAGTTQPAVRAARRRDPRLGYLGDWHTHPVDTKPSSTDLATLALFSIRHPRTPNPTLIVVRRTADGHELDARRIVSVRARPCRVRLAGDLPLDEPHQDSARNGCAPPDPTPRDDPDARDPR